MSAADVSRFVNALGTGRVLENYVVPGLRSTELGTAVGGGMVRMFEMQRDPEGEITPHDHRYGFQCYVLEGRVVNRLYHVSPAPFPAAARWARLGYDRGTRKLFGEPELVAGSTSRHVYNAGEWYQMSAFDFHSITFDQGTRVLFIEGPVQNENVSVLLPYHAGRVCDTYVWRDWMMEPGGA